MTPRNGERRPGGGGAQDAGGGSAASVPQAATIHRTVLRRVASADCLGCRLAWSGPAALAAATRHARSTGHVTVGSWESTYLYVPVGGAS